MNDKPALRTFTLAMLAVLACAAPLFVLAADGARSPSPDGAAVAFANLADGDVVPPGYTVRFSVSGMGIAPAGVAIENTGHFHLLIDLPELPTMDGPLPATPSILHFGKGQADTTLDLPEGEHTLQLLLADHAHVPHDPPVLSEPVRITVEAGAPPPDENRN